MKLRVFSRAVVLFVVVFVLSSCPFFNSTKNLDIILNSRDLYTEESYDKALSESVDEEFELIDNLDYSDNGTDYTATQMTCSIEDWGISEIRQTEDMVAFGLDEATLYAGGLVKGSAFEDGNFTPITIPRAGGTIFVTGLQKEPGELYSIELDEITGANVNQAIKDIIVRDSIPGTTANASFRLMQTYSYKHLMFSLGIDARYGKGTVAADLEAKTQTEKNTIVMKFVQKYYDVYFEHPETAVSVFRDGISYSDAENQITSDNPPLYVSKVSYGRIVFFVFESEYNAADIKAAVKYAYDGAVVDVEVKAGLTAGKVMENTDVSYTVFGGAAGLALAPIDSASAAAMFDAVKGFLGDKEAANFSASNPGAPISYTLRYLKNREIARMSYAVQHTRKDCTVDYATSNPDQNKYKVTDLKLYCLYADDGGVGGPEEFYGRIEVTAFYVKSPGVYIAIPGNIPKEVWWRAAENYLPSMKTGDEVNLNLDSSARDITFELPLNYIDVSYIKVRGYLYEYDPSGNDYFGTQWKQEVRRTFISGFTQTLPTFRLTNYGSATISFSIVPL